jgi:Putative transposase
MIQVEQTHLAAGRPSLLGAPPLANERLSPGPDGLVRIALKKPFSDGTVAVDLDPLSLLCRLVALVPAPSSDAYRSFNASIVDGSSSSPT